MRTPSIDKWRISLPTLLTLVRVAMVPFIVRAMLSGRWGEAFLLFVGAAITDVLDGACARWWNDKTLLGTYLDPVADKILILSSFFTLAFVDNLPFAIPWWFVLLVLIKELLLIVGIGVLYYVYGSVPMQPMLLGKLAMTAQAGFIMWLFACYFFHWMPIKTYNAMLALVILVVVASLMHYGFIGLRWLTQQKQR